MRKRAHNHILVLSERRGVPSLWTQHLFSVQNIRKGRNQVTFSHLLFFILLSYRPGTLHDFHSHEIAEQLTLLDAELFYKIEVRR